MRALLLVVTVLLVGLAAAAPAGARGPHDMPRVTNLGDQRIGTSRTYQVAFDPWVGDAVLVDYGIGGPDHADFTVRPSRGTRGRGIQWIFREVFYVTFTPSSLGPKRAFLGVRMFGSPPRHVGTELIGNGVGPSAALSPGSLDFPSTKVGSTSSVQTAVLENTGIDPVRIGRARVRGPFHVRFCGPWPHTIPPGGRCEISVRFQPGSTGARTGKITLYDSAPGSPRTVTLSGYGLPRHPPAEATVNPIRDRLATGSVLRANGTPAVRVAVLADDPEGKACRQPGTDGVLHAVKCKALHYTPARVAGRHWSHRLPKLPAGDYELLVRAKDRDGATQPGRRHFTVD